jgi:N-acetylneuraminic acid mutarotase
MGLRLAVAVSVATFVGVAAAGAVPLAVGSWTREAPLRDARAAHAVVIAGGSILAVGGTGPRGAPVLTVERFDGRAWSHETQLPVPGGLNATAAAVVGSRVYVIGGFGGTGNTPTAAVHVYDVGTQTWSRAAPLSAPRGGHAAVVLGGRIHVLGGGNAVQTLMTHSVYDPKTDSWTNLAPLRRSKGSPAAVVRGGRIYAIGGRSGSFDFRDVEIYHPVADRWTSGPPIPPRGTAGAAVYGRSIYLFGGESQSAGRVLNEVLRLRPGARAWEKVKPMPTARAFARAVTFRGAVWVLGGSRATASTHGASGTNVVERLTVPARSR